MFVVVILATFYASVSRAEWARNAIAAGSAAGAGPHPRHRDAAPRCRPGRRCAASPPGAAAFLAIGVLKWPLLIVLPALVALAIAWEWQATR